MVNDAKAEFEAFKTIHEALSPLEPEARSRVVNSAMTLLAIDSKTLPQPNKHHDVPNDEEDEDAGEVKSEARAYSNFAQLYDDAAPETNAQGALVAGYWLQVLQGNETFTGQALNKELTQLGHKVANITMAINKLKSEKPMLMLQLKKSGSSKQARKTYQLSEAGVKRVEEMISG